MNDTRTYHDNENIELSPSDVIALRDHTLAERLYASYDQYEVLLTRHNRMEREASVREDRLMLLIIALIILGAWLGSRWLVWEQRAIRTGWVEVQQ